MIKITNPKIFKDSITIIGDLVSEVTFRITPNQIEAQAVDAANVAMIFYKQKVETEDERIITINLSTFKQILRRTKEDLKLNIKDQLIVMSGNKEFTMPFIESENEAKKKPELDFKSVVTIQSQTLSDAIDDTDIVADSVRLITKDNKFTLLAEDEKKAKIEITEAKIEGEGNSKYSIEYLKKMVAGRKINETAIVRFSTDYPIQMDFLNEHATLQFILAPRVSEDGK
jgi:proliferating cell nuclear antigen